MSKQGIDLLKPVTVEMLGTEADPCFGKFLDPRTPECSRCGDSELCAIKMAQNNKLLSEKAHSKGAFKDLEPEELADPKTIKKKVRLRIKELIRLKSRDMDFVVDDVHNIYVMHGWTKARIKKYIFTLIETKDWISKKGNLLKFHKK